MGFTSVRALLVVGAVTAALLLVAVTHGHGLGLSLDSIVYARAATSTVERGALDVPLTWWDAKASEVPLAHFPPAFPLALAEIGAATGATPYAVARWLNAVCLFAILLILFLPIADNGAAVVVMIALLAGPSFATMYLWLWSEPLFLLLAVVALRVGTDACAGRPSSGRLALLGLLCGLATFPRYRLQSSEKECLCSTALFWWIPRRPTCAASR